MNTRSKASRKFMAATSIAAMLLGSLALTGCGNGDDMPPMDDDPAMDQPMDEQPMDEQPMDEQPGMEQDMGTDPAMDDPAMDEDDSF
ncbi:hypothetical protein SAMN05192555_110157 [Franzmannia pantelleriensis]|uniref:Uncharacterized protein n=1 Tax=Franzmannia pantelleriensis TaxID=48727 RepID=A0A1G9REP7_9GAMM|nr:hypothetical protein [Halomonas pantelleriensis]SDM21540.1 hypothetical protein SAMN05192555_110157 [Halomonas pantelleriensis]